MQGYGQKFMAGLGGDPNASPLDNMPWPQGNVGAPSQAPQIAQALSAGDSALPPNATPAQGALPTAEAVKGGVLAGIPQETKLQIAK